MNWDNAALDLRQQPDDSSTVTIRFHRRGSEQWEERTMSVQEYFGAGHSQDLMADLDWVPRIDVTDHLADIDTTDLAVTRVSVQGDGTQEIEITQTFWNEGRSRIVEIRHQEDGDVEPYWEAIVELRRENDPDTCEVLRLGRDQGAVLPLLHSIVRSADDGTEEEHTIFQAR